METFEPEIQFGLILFARIFDGVIHKLIILLTEILVFFPDDVISVRVLDFPLENYTFDLVVTAIGKDQNCGLGAEFITKGIRPSPRPGANDVNPHVDCSFTHDLRQDQVEALPTDVIEHVNGGIGVAVIEDAVVRIADVRHDIFILFAILRSSTFNKKKGEQEWQYGFGFRHKFFSG